MPAAGTILGVPVVGKWPSDPVESPHRALCPRRLLAVRRGGDDRPCPAPLPLAREHWGISGADRLYRLWHDRGLATGTHVSQHPAGGREALDPALRPYQCRSGDDTLRRGPTNMGGQGEHTNGCIQRQRTFSGATLIQTLVFGWLHQPQATLEQLTQMAATVGVVVTPQGLDKRFTEALARCLKQVLEAAVAQVIASNQVVIPLLNRFTGVLIQDSSVILLPADLATTWRGCGGTNPAQGASALKIQVRLDLTTGQIQGPHLQDGRVHDLRAPEQTRQMKAGALRLADLGYFSLAHLQDLGEQGTYWLTRWRVGTVVRNEQGKTLELLPWLNSRTLP